MVQHILSQHALVTSHQTAHSQQKCNRAGTGVNTAHEHDQQINKCSTTHACNISTNTRSRQHSQPKYIRTGTGVNAAREHDAGAEPLEPPVAHHDVAHPEDQAPYGNQVYYTIEKMLLVKIMLCSSLHCQQYFELKYISCKTAAAF